jgi:DNA end-binding protein Ku
MKSVQNTSLSIGLLNTPVKIFAAGSKEKEVRLNLCGPKGEPVEQVYRIKGSDEIVDRDNLQKSYDGHMIDPTDLQNAEAASCLDEDGNDLKQIRVESFVPLKDVPFERATGLYYIGPNQKGGSAESLMTLIEGMKKKKVAAIAKVVLRSRQKILALYVKEDILHAVCLNFKANLNLREDSELRQDVKLKKPVIDMMSELIESATGDVSVIDEIEDTFVARKSELVAAAAKGEKVKTPEAKESVGDDLMDQLQRSINATKKKEKVSA